ncbi:MAG: hypothetical protein M1165_01590 [Candidatus Pacearchaeota archaeon]|nr:hypothetical protein [Candidatus Pacearchaeota archaeon]
MPSNIKPAQVTGGFALLFGGVFFIIITLLVSLLPSSTIKASLFVWVLVSVFLILFAEAALYWIRQSLKIKEENMQDLRNKGIVSQSASLLAVFSRYQSIVSSVFLILFFLALIAGAVYYFMPQLKAGINFSVQFYVLLGIYLGYFILLRLILKRIMAKISSKAGNFAREQLPTCAVESDGLAINLPFKKGKIGIFAIGCFIFGIAAVFLRGIGQYIAAGLFIILFLIIVFWGNKSKVYYPIKIKFSEIQEIKSLSFVEAQSLRDYKIGPDITLKIQSARDLINFLKDPYNPQNRPNVYAETLDSSGAKTLLIRGQNIFYLVAVGNENADEIVKQVQKQIGKR